MGFKARLRILNDESSKPSSCHVLIFCYHLNSKENYFKYFLIRLLRFFNKIKVIENNVFKERERGRGNFYVITTPDSNNKNTNIII